jgi:hypothetical protein
MRIHPVSKRREKTSAASEGGNKMRIGWGTGSEGLNVKLVELEDEEGAGDEGVAERKVYAL